MLPGFLKALQEIKSMNLLSLSQVAVRLGVSEATLRQFKNELPGAVRVGLRTKWTEESIAEFIQRGGCRGGASSTVGA